MDLLDAFKSEVFRPLVTLIVPGAIALAPYPVVLGYYVPKVPSFWEDHPSGFVAILIVCIIAAGLILENLGAFIESSFWDKRMARKDDTHQGTWDEYLKLELKDEIVGQRYLRTFLVRMKFELSMVPALLSLWFGLLWMNRLYKVWPFWGFILVTGFLFILAGYLLLESYLSAKNLARTRKLIVEAVKDKLSKNQAKLSGS
jgi:hypothetical protein